MTLNYISSFLYFFIFLRKIIMHQLVKLTDAIWHFTAGNLFPSHSCIGWPIFHRLVIQGQRAGLFTQWHWKLCDMHTCVLSSQNKVSNSFSETWCHMFMTSWHHVTILDVNVEFIIIMFPVVITSILILIHSLKMWF